MSQFRQPPPIEDLSDISWQRVERDLFARLELDGPVAEPAPARPSRRAWRWAAGGALAAVAAAALILVLSRGENAGEHKPQLSRLVTEGAPSSITVRDAAITAAPHTALLVTESGSAGIHVILERGAVDCTVPPRKNRPPFVVVAGGVQVSVTGTRFSVARYGDTAEVVVERGQVTILAAGERYLVGPGERWPDKSAAAETADEPEMYLEDDLSKRRAPAHKRPAKPKKVKKRERPETPETADEAEPSPKERFAAAARLERSDPAAALAIYRQLARERAGVWSANALYAQAELELRRGNESRAKKLLERYLKRYPKGPNAAIAKSELQRLSD